MTAQAEKLPTDKGLQVSLKPYISRIRVGQVLVFHMTFDDDDAAFADGSVNVQGVGGTGVSADGPCTTPVQRQRLAAGADVQAVFRRPGRYLVRAVVATRTCYYGLTHRGDERVVVSRMVTVSR